MDICQQMRDHIKAAKDRLRDITTPYKTRVQNVVRDQTAIYNLTGQWMRYYAFLQDCVRKYEERHASVIWNNTYRSTPQSLIALYDDLWVWAKSFPETEKQLRVGRSRNAIIRDILEARVDGVLS